VDLIKTSDLKRGELILIRKFYDRKNQSKIEKRGESSQIASL